MTQFESSFNLIKKPRFIGLFVVSIILIYCFADRPVALYFHDFDLRTHAYWLNALTTLGKWQIYIILFLFAALYFKYIQKNTVYELRSWYLFGCALIPNVLCFVLKISLSRARPELFFNNHLFGFYWFQLKDVYWSCPSGHALSIVSLVSGLGVLFPRYFYVLLSFAFLIAMSRILLYFHYLSDVLIGFYLGILIVGLWTQYFKKNYSLV